VLENRGLRRIFGLKRVAIIGGRRKLRCDEFHNLYSSADIITMIKSRRIIVKESTFMGEKCI
jgi:hypothetical protein